MKTLNYKIDNLNLTYTVYSSDYTENRYSEILNLLEYLQKVGIIDTSAIRRGNPGKNIRVSAENRVVYDLLQNIMNHWYLRCATGTTGKKFINVIVWNIFSKFAEK